MEKFSETKKNNQIHKNLFLKNCLLRFYIYSFTSRYVDDILASYIKGIQVILL